MHFQDQLIKNLDKICDLSKNSDKISKCKNKINSVMPVIMDSAKVVVNPQSICFTLHFCLKPFVETEKVSILYVKYFNL